MRARASIALLLGAVLGLALASPAQVKPGDNLIVEGIPPIPDELVARLTQYQNIRSASSELHKPWQPPNHQTSFPPIPLCLTAPRR